jgi:cathepsin B
MPYYKIAAIVLTLAVSTFASLPVLTSNFIDDVNAQKPGWRAGMNSRFTNLTLDQARSLLGLAEEPLPESQQRKVTSRSVNSITLPQEFDASVKWPKCVQPIRDQSGCGGCWAFASAGAFGFRYCVATNSATNIAMSPQYPISCDTGNNGCGGGTISGPWKFYASSGSVADSDYPFTSTTGISGTCNLKSGAKKYYSSSYKLLMSVADMQTEIYTNGPIQVGLAVYNDFFSYKSGVYSYTSGAYAGGHSVYLTGWGVDGYGTPYWIAVNSWGSGWGTHFKNLI